MALRDGRSQAAGEAELYGRLAAMLAGQERVCLCTVIQLAGSGPRRAGAWMIVRSNGEIAGSIGGGALEAQAGRWAQAALASGPARRRFALDLQQAADEGMTCGGTAELLLEPLDPGAPGVRAFFEAVRARLLHAEPAWLATRMSTASGRLVVSHALFTQDRPVATWPEGATLPDVPAARPAVPVLIERADAADFLAPLAPGIRVYIFGGGHIAFHLVPLCRRVGFLPIVVDDRPEFASRERFPDAHEVIASTSLCATLERLPIDARSYVVIVTRGHGGDALVLRESLQRGPAFVGMIGSARKRTLVYDELRRAGIADAQLARVACPIGLPIGAETPEEIALSIAAELVATRADRRPVQG